MNEITLYGRLGATPTIHYSRDGQSAVGRLSLAVSDDYFDRSKGQWVRRPAVWHNVVIFNRQLAENVHDSLDKGMEVAVTGTLGNDNWTRPSDEPGAEDTVIERTQLRASKVSADLAHASAKVTKNPKPDAETAPATAA